MVLEFISSREKHIRKIHNRRGIVVVITGGIASGKSFLLNCFKKQGFMAYDTDKLVHNLLMQNKQVYEQIAEQFSDCIVDNKINRKKLADIVFSSRSMLKVLEDILHPLVKEYRLMIINKLRAKGQRSVVFEVPLFFESMISNKADNIDNTGVYQVVILALSSLIIQYDRAIKRKGMTKDKFNAIIANQLPNAYKEEYANYVVPTGCNSLATRKIIQKITGRDRFKRSCSRYRNNRTQRKRWAQDY